MLRNANSAVLFSLIMSIAAVPHRVGTHPGHAYSRSVPAAARLSTHNMAGRSNMTTSTLGVMPSCFSGASSMHRTMSDFVPSFSFPLADSDGGHG